MPEAKGDKVSFLLEVISNSSSEIDFLSRESGQGPCLVIMPYPTTSESRQIVAPSSPSQSGQTFGFVANASQMAETAPVAVELQSSQLNDSKINQKLALP